jgi:hypothetical protein
MGGRAIASPPAGPPGDAESVDANEAAFGVDDDDAEVKAEAEEDGGRLEQLAVLDNDAAGPDWAEPSSTDEP